VNAVILNLETSADRLGSLKYIASMGNCCSKCLAAAGVLMAVFREVVRSMDLSEDELSQIREEMTPDNLTADETAFIDRFINSLRPRKNT